MKIAIIGAGYVGMTTAVVLAYLNHNVTVVEKDENKLDLLHEGKSLSTNPASNVFLKRCSTPSALHRVLLKRFLMRN